MHEDYSQDINKQYDFFNKLFFNGELSKIPVSFEKYSKGDSGAAGLYYVRPPHRISLNAESFSSRSDKYIDSVLIHEMIHHWMEENNLNTKQHHSKVFKDKVDEINIASGNKYKVGYTEVSVAVDDDDLEIKKTYWVVPLAQSGLALKNVQATFHVMSEGNYSLEEVMRFLEWINFKTNMDTKSIYILEVNINNNFITEDYLKGKIDVIPKGYYHWATEYDKHLFKLLKQSKDYSIIGRYNWRTETFEKTNKEQEVNIMKVYLKEGIRVIAEDGSIYEVEDGDYTIIDNQIRNGPILNIDIVKSIADDEKREQVLDLIEMYGENYIINQLITGMNLELEHTDDNYESLQIAVDHIVEIPDYYSRLIAMELEAEKSL